MQKYNNQSVILMSNSGTSTVKRWSAPAEGQVKLNVDASIFEGVNSFSVGMVLRDYHGGFLGGKVMRFPGLVTVFEAEAMGVKEALARLAEKSYTQVIIETDSLMMVQALHKNIENYLEVSNILEACRLSIADMGNVKIIHVKKLGNRAAHSMARVPCTVNSCNLFESPPQCLLETLMLDAFDH